VANVALIGYRGTGKSTVARLLAKRLRLEMLCLDDEVVKKAGRSIPDIVRIGGWELFRALESEVVREAVGRQGRVLDTGGGVVTRLENVQALRDWGTVIWLTATPEELAGRISESNDRPSLTGAKSFVREIGEVLAEREPLYRAAAHFEVSTSGRTAEEVASEAAKLVRK